MADGRDLIEETVVIIGQLVERLPAVKPQYSDEEFKELESYLESASKWVASCRKKVWLRGKEGTDMAQKCLDAAKHLQEVLDKPAAALETAADLTYQLENLARVIATKSQVMT
ncbi:MAG: hypothetical protein ACP5TV_05830 [Anaerolineae bacterium]